MNAWTEVGSDRLRSAQKRLGLTNRQVAEQLFLSDKQWARWRDQGRVRTAAIPTVERVLQIEIPREPLLAANGPGGPLAELEAAVAHLARQQVRILAALDAIREQLADVLSRPQHTQPQPLPPAAPSTPPEGDRSTGSPP